MSENNEVTEALCDSCNSTIDPDAGSVLSNDEETLCLECAFNCENCNYIGNVNEGNYQTVDGSETW